MKTIKGFLISCFLWSSLMTALPVYVLYKVLAGCYHLLDKLISKI